MPDYYISLGTRETWQEDAPIDYEVQGFPEQRRRDAEAIKPGDLLLCYLKRPLSRFVGVLEATDRAYYAKEPRIWKSGVFPVRIKTRLVVKVPEDRGVHRRQVKEHSAQAPSWDGYIRWGPQRLPAKDAKWIVERLHTIASEMGTGFWLKIGYHTASGEDARYWDKLPWVSDSPGRHSPRWKHQARPRQGQTHPPYGPRYQVGDRLVMYLTGSRTCPAILEVTADPCWDPDRVDRESAPGEGDRWGVLTEVNGISAVPPGDAPALQRIGVAPASVASKGHISLENWQYEEAERLIGGVRHPRRRGRATAERIPIEAGNVAGYDVTTRDDVRRAERRESELVAAYVAMMEGRGDDLSSNGLRVPGTNARMRTDVFNWTRNQLIEAKASAARGDIRMAIGQLADYSHCLRGSLKGEPDRAVLLDAKPRPDLIDLLDKQDIKVIWQEGSGFADNAGGAFT